EAQPVPHARPIEAVRGDQPRALGQVADDGVALGEVSLAGDLEERDAPVGVLCEEAGRSRLPFLDVELHEAVRNAELLEHQANLVTVAGRKVVVQCVGFAHRSSLKAEAELRPWLDTLQKKRARSSERALTRREFCSAVRGSRRALQGARARARFAGGL